MIHNLFGRKFKNPTCLRAHLCALAGAVHVLFASKSIFMTEFLVGRERVSGMISRAHNKRRIPAFHDCSDRRLPRRGAPSIASNTPTGLLRAKGRRRRRVGSTAVAVKRKQYSYKVPGKSIPVRALHCRVSVCMRRAGRVACRAAAAAAC